MAQAPGVPTGLSQGWFAVCCFAHNRDNIDFAVWADALCSVPACCLAPCDWSLCKLQELYSDMQRTTEQMVKDKLQEQQVRILRLCAHATCRKH